MNKKINVCGYEFQVEPTCGDSECFCLLYTAEDGNEVYVLDSTAEPDFYGPVDEVAARMADYVREHCQQLLPCFTLLGAVVSENGRVLRLDSREKAYDFGEELTDCDVRKLEEPEEIATAKALLELDDDDEVRAIYAYKRGYICRVQDVD